MKKAKIESEKTLIEAPLKKEQRQLFFRRLLANKSLITGGVIIIILIIIALLGPLLTPYSPYEMSGDRLEIPNSAHLLGTDPLGRDILTRIVYGARITMGVGVSVAIISGIIGMVVGLYASYYKTLDHILMRISDGLMSIPAILLAIALMAALGADSKNVIIALSIIYTPNVARVIRSTAIVVREKTYIEAMRAQGASALRIIWGHILPNTISPLIVLSTFIFSEAIIVEAALSFLGVGVPAPDPSWGNMLYDGKVVIFEAWWMTVIPGFMIFSAILSLNLLGDGLRDLIDPY